MYKTYSPIVTTSSFYII